MKIYNLICPKCDIESMVFADLSNPENVFCKECGEDLNLEEIRTLVNGWKEYLEDVDQIKKENLSKA
jgi:transcription elongation factor Elf1